MCGLITKEPKRKGGGKGGWQRKGSLLFVKYALSVSPCLTVLKAVLIKERNAEFIVSARVMCVVMSLSRLFYFKYMKCRKSK